MGNMQYTVTRDGQQIEAGYGVPDICNLSDCCGFYFCENHLHFPLKKLGEPTVQSLCGSCWDRWAQRDWEVDA